MKKNVLVLLTGFMGLTLASCGATTNNFSRDENDESGHVSDDEHGTHIGGDEGGSGTGGSAEDEYKKVVDDFDKIISKDSYEIKIEMTSNSSESSTSLSYSIGSCEEGFWYINSEDGTYEGSAYMKNGNSYLEYDVDMYGGYESESSEVSSEYAEAIFELQKSLSEVFLFMYQPYMSESHVSATTFLFGRECTTYECSDIDVEFTIDDELKINLEIILKSLVSETRVRVTTLKIGSSVSFPF